MTTRTTQKYPYFDPETSAEVVLSRMGPGTGRRVREVMGILVRHLHAAVKEIRPSHEEWLAAISYLTRTGQMCTDWRQEFILLSDTLGVTMLVDALIHARRADEPVTESTILGPFYVKDAPHYENGADLCKDGKGEPLVVRGTVTDSSGQPIAGAIIDTWQTNQDGFYDVQQRGIQPEMNLRGVFTTDARGEYTFRSVKPRFYPIPYDGPVGELLLAMDRGPNRAAHIHFIVEADGFRPVITHVFTADCPYLDQDAVFGVKESLIGDFVQEHDEEKARRLGVRAPFWTLDWDFVLARVASGRDHAGLPLGLNR